MNESVDELPNVNDFFGTPVLPPPVIKDPPNCIVPLSLEMLSMLLGGLKVFDVRVAQHDTWGSDFELLVHNPNVGPTHEGMIHPRANVTITGPLPQVAFEP